MNDITLATPCFWVQDDEVKSGTLNDLSFFIETSTRPGGVGPKYYATTITKHVFAEYDDTGNETSPERSEDVWVLAKWATWGGPEVVLAEFGSEQEAQDAAEQTYVNDILDNPEFSVFLTREDAEDALAQMREDAL